MTDRAERIRELADDDPEGNDPDAWPELEEELWPTTLPFEGPFVFAMEYLHGARVTMEANLGGPCKLLMAAAARSALGAAERVGEPASDDERAGLAPIASGTLEAEGPEELLDALTRLAIFIEGRAHDKLARPGDDGDRDDGVGNGDRVGNGERDA